MTDRPQWLSPSPLWSELVEQPSLEPYRRPTLLRFASDTFMEELLALLAAQPERLRNYVAQPETWRSPRVGLPAPGATTATAEDGEDALTFTLFQPVHSRFYLVAATLACRVPGLPDHRVRTENAERVSFVLRRVRSNVAGAPTPESWSEAAWTTTGAEPGWTPATAAPLASEERLPMFPFQTKSTTAPRRLYAGLIPVGRRQSYVSAPDIAAPSNGQAANVSGGTGASGGIGTAGASGASSPEAGPSKADRMIDFQRQVIDPWVELVAWIAGRDISDTDHINPSFRSLLPPAAFRQIGSTDPDELALERDVARSAERSSALILLDFAEFLQVQLPALWDAVDSANAGNLGGAVRALYDKLEELKEQSPRYISGQTRPAKSLRAAIKQAWDKRDSIEGTTGPGSDASGLPGEEVYERVRLDNMGLRDALRLNAEQARPLVKLMEAALPLTPPATAHNVRLPARGPDDIATGTGKPANPPAGNEWFVIRCVYERPHCGAAAPAAVSEPTEPFRFASFFDPDAPSRSLQVALPVDTSPAALRKYDRNVAFMLSDQLRKQIKRIRSTKHLVDGKFASPLDIDIGVICSFSIPIITICALILLLIMVSLLNIIFFWLPFFVFCFPVPKLKARLS